MAIQGSTGAFTLAGLGAGAGALRKWGATMPPLRGWMLVGTATGMPVMYISTGSALYSRYWGSLGA